jgi:hypothetical protein
MVERLSIVDGTASGSCVYFGAGLSILSALVTVMDATSEAEF